MATFFTSTTPFFSTSLTFPQIPPLRPTFSPPLLRRSDSSPFRSLSSPFRTLAVADRKAGEEDPKSGVAVYKPKSYEVLVADAAKSLLYALDDGKTRLEIDFPPLPSNVSTYKGSSDDFIDANIQLALAVVRKVQDVKGTKSCIVFPDQPEKRRASQMFKTALETIDGLTTSSLVKYLVGPSQPSSDP